MMSLCDTVEGGISLYPPIRYEKVTSFMLENNFTDVDF